MAVKVFFYTLRPYDEQGILEDLAKQRGIGRRLRCGIADTL